MKRRNFLKTLGIGALAVPVAIEAVKGIEVPKENFLEQHPFDKYNFESMGFIFPDPKTINLIAPVEPSKAGDAIYLYTDEDKLRIHDVIHIPAKYFDDKSASDLPQIYKAVSIHNEYGDAIIADCFTTVIGLPVYKYKCLPFDANLALTKEIPITQKLIIGASVFSSDDFV